MGREIKRVAVDFDWPVGEVWEGYLNPFYKHRRACPFCDGSGYNPKTKQIADDWYDFKRTGSRWEGAITQDEVDKLIEKNRLYDFTHKFIPGDGWKPKDPAPVVTAEMVNKWSQSGMGHDAINRWICVEQRARRLGVWGHCAHCSGKGEIWDTKENKKKCDEWKQTEPPKGDGWQLWETVSEGSPITPVFATADELVDHMCQPKEAGKTIPWGTGYDRASAEKWVKEIGWAPSMMSSAAGVQDGVTALGSKE